MAIMWPEQEPFDTLIKNIKKKKISAHYVPFWEKLLIHLNCLVISSHLSLKMISELWTWFPENQVETGKSESWKFDSCKISNL